MKNQTREERIEALRKYILKRKYFSILLALFTLGVNIFAWFVFTSTSQLELDATVASWNVQFRDETGEEIKSFVIDVTYMKPGMSPYHKTITIHNESDVNATFEYQIPSFVLLGKTIQMSNSIMLDYLKDNYPFSVQFYASKEQLSATDDVEFDIDIHWPYESSTPTYFKQDAAYEFEPSFQYYQLNYGTYRLYELSNETAYNQIKSSLYLEKDDADSYFGMMCHEYEATYQKPCLVLNIQLMVKQENE